MTVRRKDAKMEQTGIFQGRVLVPYAYGCFGWTRGGGSVWHGGIDLVGADDATIRMPYYTAADGSRKAIRGTVVTARIVTDHSNRTWEWGWYVCVQLDAAQTPDAVNYLYFCHCAQLLVQAGQRVQSGDALAVMGNSGNAALNDPPYKHCHLEARATATGTGLDPTAYSGTANAAGSYGSAEDTSAAYVYGIDVSKYQGTIDWKQVAASGVKFALLRVGSSTNSGPYVDPTFEANYKGCRDNGIAVGAYLYTYATSEADQNAELAVFLPALSGKTFEYPVFVDVEDNSLTGLGKDTLTALTKRMMDILDQLGYLPGWYSYTNYITNYLDAATLVDYPLWVADYRSTLGYTGKCDIWQYTSSGSVPGISGAVDLNRDYHGYNRKDKPTGKQLQIMTVGPVDNAAAMILWGISNRYGLGYDAQYTDDTKQAQVLTIGPASAGDAMVVWAKAQELGAPYKSKYVEG